MASFIFNKLKKEDGSYLLLQDTGNILLEDQDNISVVLDYTHVAYVDQLPRTVYVTRGEK